MTHDRDYHLDEERLIVRQSGEIPEVAFHGSLYYLTDDPEGPGLIVSSDERRELAEQALQRYREIILRDLCLENRGKSIYRGVERAAINWRRCRKFCARERLASGDLQAEVAAALRLFLHGESREVRAGTRRPSLNCSAAGLRSFAGELGLAPNELPPNWSDLCVADAEPAAGDQAAQMP